MSWSIWVSNVRSTEKGLPNSKVFGEAFSGCFTEFLSDCSVVYSTRDQFFTFPTLNRMFRKWWFTSLVSRSTMPFSSLEYGIVVWCAILCSCKCDSKSLTNYDLKSVMSSSGAVTRHVCRHNASAAAIAVTPCLGNKSTDRMMKRMYFSPMSEGKGPIVSIEILSFGFRVEFTNRDARMVLCLVPFLACGTALYKLSNVMS